MNIGKIIADRSWRAGWPQEVHEAVEATELPDVPWKAQVARYRRIFQAMEGVQGARCGVSEIQDLVQKMQAWSSRHASYFSWPSTMDGWSRAVWATMAEPQGKEDLAWLWAGYGPSLVHVLSEKPSAQPWANSLLKALPQKNPPVPEVRAEVVATAPPPSPAPAKKSYAHRSERPLSPEVAETRAWLLARLSEIAGSKDAEGTLQERFDRALKEQIDAEGRPGPRMQAGWIEYRLLPAVAGLDAEKINMLVDFWPSHHSRSLIDPLKSLSSPRFWALIEETPDPVARAAYVERFLPSVIDGSEWSADLRFNAGVAMFDWTQKKPEAFEERLGLWRSWGGKMDDAAVPAQVEGSMFSKAVPRSQTMEEWITSKANPEWERIISQGLDRKKRRGLP